MMKRKYEQTITNRQTKWHHRVDADTNRMVEEWAEDQGVTKTTAIIVLIRMGLTAHANATARPDPVEVVERRTNDTPAGKGPTRL